MAHQGLSNIRQYSRGAHEFGIEDRLPSSVGRAPAATRCPIRPAPFPRGLADATHHEYCCSGRPGWMEHELDRSLAVDRRIGVGHAGHGGEPAARAAAVPVPMVSSSSEPGWRRWTYVDQPGGYDLPEASRIVSSPLSATSAGDAATVDQEVGHPSICCPGSITRPFWIRAWHGWVGGQRSEAEGTMENENGHAPTLVGTRNTSSFILHPSSFRIYPFSCQQPQYPMHATPLVTRSRMADWAVGDR